MTKPNRTARKFLKAYFPRKEIEDKIDSRGKTNACLLVVSPTSGFGNAARLAPSVAKRLARFFSDVIVKNPLKSTYTVAVILGGDGAFSEAANGMLCRKDGATITLAHCPGGSGCAIAGNTLGFWKGQDAMKACDVIGHQNTKPMDVIQVDCADGKSRYCTSCIAGGNYTDTIALADDYRWTYHLFGPTFRYIIGMFKSYLNYGPTDNGRVMKYTGTTSEGKEETFESPTFGLALYNSGKVMHDSKLATATPFSGDLSLSLAKTYGGLGKQLKYVGALKNANEEMDTANSQYSEFADIHLDMKVASIKCEPLENPKKKTRPCLLAFDGEMGIGNNDFMLAPFTARVLPGEIKVVVA